MKPAHDALLAHFDRVDPVIAGVVRAYGPCTMGTTRRGTCFESLASAIASQQISGLVARRILERLVAAHDGAFPAPAHIAAASVQLLREVGFSHAKIAALKDLAAKTLEGSVPDDATAAALEDEALIERLVAVRGIGRWSAQMLLMFQLERPDVLPVDDFGVRAGFRLAYGLKRMPLPKALLAYGARWAPYRSYASWYLWRAVELHAEKRLPTRAGRAPRVAQSKPRTPARSTSKTKTRTRSRGSVAVGE
jgi:DNA-3-methyladenine glycosylase II